MPKAPYIRPRMRGNTMVYGFRPTEELLRAFPDLTRETFTSSSEANTYGNDIKRKFEKWKSGEHHDIYVNKDSVEALVQYYLNSMRFKNIKTASTKRSYREHLRHVAPIHITNTSFDRMFVSNVDYDYVNTLWLHIEDKVSTHKANHTFKVLKLVWNEAFRGGKVKNNPFSSVKLPKLPDRQVMWTEDQIKGMVAYCDEQDQHAMGTMITMCYEFCQRPIDVRKMKWSNVDGRTGVSNFRQQKTGKQMAIKVTNSVQERLHLHQRRNTDDFIFATNYANRPFTADRVNKVFRSLAEGYGLPIVPLVDQFNKDGSQKYSAIWLADLRRTGITHASQCGCSDRELMSLSGHRNPQMLVVYAVEGEVESTNANKKRGLLNG